MMCIDVTKALKSSLSKINMLNIRVPLHYNEKEKKMRMIDQINEIRLMQLACRVESNAQMEFHFFYASFFFPRFFSVFLTIALSKFER